MKKIFRALLLWFAILGGLNTTYAIETIGQLNASNPAPSNSIQVLKKQSDWKILVWGEFNTISSTTRYWFARLNSDFTLDTSCNANLNSSAGISSIELQSDWKILIGWSFTTVNGTARANVARLNTNCTLDTTFTANTNSSISSIAIKSDWMIFLGGEFTTINGTSKSYLGLVSSVWALQTGFSTTINSAVNTIAVQSDGKVIAWGSSLTSPRAYIARFNGTTGAYDSTFTPVLNWTVNKIKIDWSWNVYIWGYFTTANLVTTNWLVKVTTLWANSQTFWTISGNVTRRISTFEIHPTSWNIYISWWGGGSATNLNILSSTGTVITNSIYFWGTGADGRALVIDSSDRLIVWGNFNSTWYSYGGTSTSSSVRNNFAILDSSTVCLNTNSNSTLSNATWMNWAVTAQNTNPSGACYYSCLPSFTGTSCNSLSSPVTSNQNIYFWNYGWSSTLKRIPVSNFQNSSVQYGGSSYSFDSGYFSVIGDSYGEKIFTPSYYEYWNLYSKNPSFLNWTSLSQSSINLNWNYLSIYQGNSSLFKQYEPIQYSFDNKRLYFVAGATGVNIMKKDVETDSVPSTFVTVSVNSALRWFKESPDWNYFVINYNWTYYKKSVLDSNTSNLWTVFYNPSTRTTNSRGVEFSPALNSDKSLGTIWLPWNTGYNEEETTLQWIVTKTVPPGCWSSMPSARIKQSEDRRYVVCSSLTGYISIYDTTLNSFINSWKNRTLSFVNPFFITEDSKNIVYINNIWYLVLNPINSGGEWISISYTNFLNSMSYSYFPFTLLPSNPWYKTKECIGILPTPTSNQVLNTNTGSLINSTPWQNVNTWAVCYYELLDKTICWDSLENGTSLTNTGGYLWTVPAQTTNPSGACYQSCLEGYSWSSCNQLNETPTSNQTFFFSTGGTSISKGTIKDGIQSSFTIIAPSSFPSLNLYPYFLQEEITGNKLLGWFYNSADSKVQHFEISQEWTGILNLLSYNNTTLNPLGNFDASSSYLFTGTIPTIFYSKDVRYAYIQEYRTTGLAKFYDLYRLDLNSGAKVLFYRGTANLIHLYLLESSDASSVFFKVWNSVYKKSIIDTNVDSPGTLFAENMYPIAISKTGDMYLQDIQTLSFPYLVSFYKKNENSLSAPVSMNITPPSGWDGSNTYFLLSWKLNSDWTKLYWIGRRLKENNIALGTILITDLSTGETIETKKTTDYHYFNFHTYITEDWKNLVYPYVKVGDSSYSNASYKGIYLDSIDGIWAWISINATITPNRFVVMPTRINKNLTGNAVYDKEKISAAEQIQNSSLTEQLKTNELYSTGWIFDSGSYLFIPSNQINQSSTLKTEAWFIPSANESIYKFRIWNKAIYFKADKAKSMLLK